MTSAIDQYWNRAYELHGDWPSSQSDLVRLVAELRDTASTTHEALLLLAYLAYHFPCSATDDIDIESTLKSVLRSDPQNPTARLYLGHIYYDSGKYAQALSHLEQIDCTDYEALGQLWRSLKIRELAISARLFLAPIAVRATDVVAFALELRKAGAENAAIPSELVDSLLANKSRVSAAWQIERFRRAVRCLRSAIDQIAGSSVLKEKTDELIA